MTLHGASALVFATFVFAAIPGPGVTAVLGQALSRGLRPALLWGLGIVLGDACYLLVAMLGLGWVAAQFGPWFALLRWCGAGYLVYLGARCLFARPPAQGAEDAPPPPRGLARTFLGGLVVSLGNPKVVAFYCGFLPGFLDLGSLSPAGMALTAALILPTGYAVVACYAWLGARGRQGIRSARLWKLAHRGAGAALIGTGVLVAAEGAAG